MDVGKTIKLLIRQRGLTNSEAAREIGWASQAVTYHVKQSDLSTTVIKKYAEYFGMTMSDFFYIAEGEQLDSPVDAFVDEISQMQERLRVMQKHLRHHYVRSVHKRHRIASLIPADGEEPDESDQVAQPPCPEDCCSVVA